ncbi:TPA: alcohol dehydrogenase catalytic domain-containing protein, partial [Vibrio parahaemolyticus]|nr:alcohol dehydrogenase catalytic domain-containing protein [Vibrio parahaemolyticus]
MVQTTAAVICGEKNVQLRTFDLPNISADELLVKNISNSICLSTYKAALLGSKHKRVPENIDEVPVMTGHEYAGVIVEVGENLKDQFKAGDYFVLQPAMGLPSGYSAGYSYETFGGNATYSIIPKIAIDLGCVLPYHGDYFADASLAEPMSCIIGAYHASYHTTQYVYEHDMGIKEGGALALLACAGPMGIGAIDYAINGPVKPTLVVVTDIDAARLDRAESLIPVAKAKEQGVELHYVNTAQIDAPVAYL